MQITPAIFDCQPMTDVLLIGFVAGVAFACIVLTSIMLAHQAARPRIEP